MQKHAYILCSGGLDSSITALLVFSMKQYSNLTVLFFNYGQNSLEEERNASIYLANHIHASFHELQLPELKNIAQGAMTQNIPVQKSNSLKDTKEESKSWYVPCRNTIFLTYALAMAEKQFIDNKIVSDIYVGFKSEGEEPFPDTTKQFLDKINALSKESCAYPFTVTAPLIDKDKEDIVMLGNEFGFDLSKTFSCYSSNEGQHCGMCLACRLRKEGFKWAGISDPTFYKQ